MADNFAVVTQTPTTDIGPTGSIVPAMLVTFRTKPSEIAGRVTIPEAVYTPDEVARIVSVAAANLEAVQAL